MPTRPGKDTKVTGDKMTDGNRDINRNVSVILKNELKRQCDCSCELTPPFVLDPFSGAGTTGVAAIMNGRSYVGIELNKEYVDISIRRLNEYRGSFEHVQA